MTRDDDVTGDDSADPAALEQDDASMRDDVVPMLTEPTRLPGQPRRRFSPEQYYALSRVTRRDVDATDEGLWLTQEECPAITPEGIQFFGEIFWASELQYLVDDRSGIKRRSFVIRYDRAHLTRGVLHELIVLERDAAGAYEERARCGRKVDVLGAMTDVDLSRVLRERERLGKVLVAKSARAHEARITIEAGTRAVEELRDEQARQRRNQRQARRAPIAAAPITADRHIAQGEADIATARDMSARLSRAKTGGPRILDSGSTPAVPIAKKRREPVKPGRRRTGSRTAATPTMSEEAANSVESATPNTAPSAPTLADHLGGTVGFAPPIED